jgi:hypothetical protein
MKPYQVLTPESILKLKFARDLMKIQEKYEVSEISKDSLNDAINYLDEVIKDCEEDKEPLSEFNP